MGALARLEPEELIARARGGNTRALGQLLQSCEAYLMLLARSQIGRRLQGKADAADLVQETFLACHANFARFRGKTEGEFLQWLRRIMAAKLATFRRRFLGTKSRNVRLERRLALELQQTSNFLDSGFFAPQETPSRLAAHREQSVILAQALSQLIPAYREERLFWEIAERIDRSTDSVEKLWLRGMNALRRAMREMA